MCLITPEIGDVTSYTLQRADIRFPRMLQLGPSKFARIALIRLITRTCVVQTTH